MKKPPFSIRAGLIAFVFGGACWIGCSPAEPGAGGTGGMAVTGGRPGETGGAIGSGGQAPGSSGGAIGAGSGGAQASGGSSSGGATSAPGSGGATGSTGGNVGAGGASTGGRGAGTGGSNTGGSTNGSGGAAATGGNGGTAAGSGGTGGALPPNCILSSPVSFKKDVEPFLTNSCGKGLGSGCHVTDTMSTVANGGFDHAYDWVTAGSHDSSCPQVPNPKRFEVIVAVINAANPPSCSRSRRMPPPGVGRVPTACEMAALQAWLALPKVTQMHRADDSSPTTPYAMPPYN